MRSIDQQVILVTGSTDGLGRALARELADRGATVLLHGRDAAKGADALREIRDATGNERVAFYLGDLSSLAQVRALAEQILADHERLDVLVNNAGIGTGGAVTEREVNEDGHELRFAVMYLAPFLQTQLLEPLLVGSAPARVVNVASAGQAAIDFDDVMLERSYSGVQAYCQSKTALVMLTFDLADALRDQGVTVNCLHPGTYMPTKMVLEAGVNPVDSLESGVGATMRLIADPDLDTTEWREAMGVRRLNFLEDEPWDQVDDDQRVRWFGHPFRTDQLGASLIEYLPRSPDSPMHMHYGVEEMFFVLSGTLTVRTPEGEEELSRGDVVYFPEGPDGLHTFSNPTDEPVRMLGISTKRFPDVVAYPERGVAWVATRHPERPVPEGGDEGVIARFELAPDD